MNGTGRRLRERAGEERGFTLMEIMISLTVLTLVMGAIFEFYMSSQVAFSHEMAQSALDAKARRLADELSRELSYAFVQASPSDPAAEVQFQKVIGITTDGTFSPIKGNDFFSTTGSGTISYGVIADSQGNTLFRRQWENGTIIEQSSRAGDLAAGGLTVNITGNSIFVRVVLEQTVSIRGNDPETITASAAFTTTIAQ